jgi:hypothetical protein
MESKKVIEFIEPDTSNKRIDPTISSRWYAVDPKAKKYPSISPYAFCANNPIIYLDSDGQDYDYSVTYVKDKKGKTIKKVVDVTVNYKILNLTSRQMYDSDFDNIEKAANSKTGGVFDYSTTSNTYDKNGRITGTLPTEVNVKVNLQLVSSVAEVSDKDNILLIATETGNTLTTIGIAQDIGNIAAVEGNQFGKAGWIQLVLHEIGHNLGLRHKTGGMMAETIDEEATNSNLSNQNEELTLIGAHKNTDAKGTKKIGASAKSSVKKWASENTGYNNSDAEKKAFNK